MRKPLIVAVVTARDWSEAFRLVWQETFKVAAAEMGLSAPQADIAIRGLPSWPERRQICLRLGARCANYDLPELACAWTTLAIDPGWPSNDEPDLQRAKVFRPVFFALAGVIASNPDLIDDDTFARAVMGWRFLGKFGIGAEQDPILAAHLLGACLDADKDELRRWAQKWAAGAS